MVGWRSLVVIIVVAGGAFAIISASRADQASAVSSPPDQIPQLLDRIEKLERRMQALEGRQQVARQIDMLFTPAGGWLTAPQFETKAPLPHGAFIVPPQAERPARGIFLPRHIILEPE